MCDVESRSFVIKVILSVWLKGKGIILLHVLQLLSMVILFVLSLFSFIFPLHLAARGMILLTHTE